MKKIWLFSLALTLASCLGDDEACLEEININIPDCPIVYEPVCGCNNETYVNACTAEAYSILDYAQGSCN